MHRRRPRRPASVVGNIEIDKLCTCVLRVGERSEGFQTLLGMSEGLKVMGHFFPSLIPHPLHPPPFLSLIQVSGCLCNLHFQRQPGRLQVRLYLQGLPRYPPSISLYSLRGNSSLKKLSPYKSHVDITRTDFILDTVRFSSHAFIFILGSVLTPK